MEQIIVVYKLKGQIFTLFLFYVFSCRNLENNRFNGTIPTSLSNKKDLILR